MNEDIGQPHEVPQIIPEQKPKSGVLFYGLVVAGGVIFLVASTLSAGYLYAFAQIRKPIVFSEKQVFVIEKGESVQRIAEDLEKKGLVSHGFYFWLYIWKSDLSRSLQAGTYAVEGSASAKDIADMIARGDVMRDTVRVTIPEGFTLADIDARFRDAGLLKKETRRFADLRVRDFSGKFTFFSDAPQDASLEGYLFPDTYEFEKDVSLEAIAERMLGNFKEKFESVQEIMEGSGKSVRELVIMASIIEREVITPEDMKMVSGVLWKRLSIDMPLQVDATVIFAVGRNALTRDDLAVDSPYNTYRYKGLPPGPIASPGMNALVAAAQPTASDYLFYISKPNKETVFSRTLQEHNAAVAKYLK